MTITTQSPEETKEYAKKLGMEAKPGQVYALIGDLGAGKTAFSQGFAQGLGIEEYITSPTFTLLNVYESGRMPLYHFDCYRIDDPEEIVYTGIEDYLYGRGVCLIEWAYLIKDFLPLEYVLVKIETLGTNSRKIEIRYINDSDKERGF